MAHPELDRYRGIIAHSVVFEGLEPAEMDRILAHCRERRVDTRQVVLSEGQPGDGLYVILEGTMECLLLPQSLQGRPTSVRLGTLGPGRCFGEYSLIDDGPCSATVRALGPTTVCFLPQADFRRLVVADAWVARIVYGNLLRFLVSRLRGKDQELDVILLA
jgi:CRP/FNR family transcriptional regulator, cyclic AMP receptor protein